MNTVKLSNIQIHHNGNKVLQARCLITGRFVSNKLAKIILNKHLLETALTLSFCIMVNVIAILLLVK